MNIKEVPLTNALNLSLFMVNVSPIWLAEFPKSNPQSNVLDLKAYYSAARYFEEMIKILPEYHPHALWGKPEPLLQGAAVLSGISAGFWQDFLVGLYSLCVKVQVFSP